MKDFILSFVSFTALLVGIFMEIVFDATIFYIVCSTISLLAICILMNRLSKKYNL
jgi:hypothetical protein